MAATYQTIKLSRGKHASAAEGACVMELASMLAGEPFSDHPASVCPLIAALLRAYNDALDVERRQDLYRYAAEAVGSKGSRRLERLRNERICAWIAEIEGRRFARPLAPTPLRRLAPRPSPNTLAARAMRTIAKDRERMHPRVLAFVDELLAIGRSSLLPEPAQTLTATGFAGGLTVNGRIASSPRPTTP